MAQTTEYQVTGMSCGHCEASVRSEIAKLAGVEQIDGQCGHRPARGDAPRLPSPTET